MKILVTGANGFLGSGVVEELLNKGYDVIATDFCDTFINKSARIITGNLFEEEDPFHKYEEPDVLIHMAWKDGFVHNSMSHLEELPKHFIFLKKMMESGVKRVAVMGSMHEVGFYEGSINESTVCNPQSLYGISKNALRNATELLAKQNGTQLQWLRGYYIVSDNTHGSSIFSKIAMAAQKGQKLFPFTMGQNQYDFIEYSDFCKLVAKVVVQDKILGIINICSGKPEKLADRVEQFIKERGFDIKLEYGKFPDRPYDSKAIWGDDSKIQAIIFE